MLFRSTGSGHRIFVEMFTPLLLALKYRNENNIRLLHSYGARPNQLFRDYVFKYEQNPGDVDTLEFLRLVDMC